MSVKAMPSTRAGAGAGADSTIGRGSVRGRERPSQGRGIRPRPLRLLATIPRVYVGPGARQALGGSRTVLFGAQRPAWVDVLELQADESFAGVRGLRALVDRRFLPGGYENWDAVGVSLSHRDAKRYEERLLAELVPGDVLITERSVSVHLGDTWAEAKLVETHAR